VLLPVIVLLAFWEAREAQPPLRAAVSAAARAVPWLAVAVLTAYLTKEVQPEAGVDFPTPWGLRPLVALDAIGFYLRQIVLPWALVPDYGRTPPYVLNGPFPLLHVVLAAAFIGFGCLAFSKRARPLRPFARWSVLFVVCILPVSGLKPFHFQNISTVADRYLCFPMLWAALAFAHLWQILSGRGPRLVLGAALVAFGLRTLWQTPLWRDDKALFHGIIAANHRSWTGHQTLSVIAFHEGDFLASLNHGWTSLELNYRQTTLRVQIAACLAKLGHADEAIQFVRDSLRLIPLYPLLHIELADLLAAQGNHAAAEAELRDTIAMVPQDPEPKLALARLYLAVHRQDEARVLIEQALRDDPGSVEARRLLQGEDQDRGGP
jgi:hypothetical protein